jgi:hypothetical protein
MLVNGIARIGKNVLFHKEKMAKMPLKWGNNNTALYWIPRSSPGVKTKN